MTPLLVAPAFGKAKVQPVRFVDVTSQAGIEFRYVTGASGKKYIPETMGSGAAFFDYDNDGLLDLYVVNGAPMPGFRGSPMAVFQSILGLASQHEPTIYNML